MMSWCDMVGKFIKNPITIKNMDLKSIRKFWNNSPLTIKMVLFYICLFLIPYLMIAISFFIMYPDLSTGNPDMPHTCYFLDGSFECTYSQYLANGLFGMPLLYFILTPLGYLDGGLIGLFPLSSDTIIFIFL